MNFVAWWGAVTGTVSVVVLIVRFIYDRGASKRDRKDLLRQRLRELASGARTELREARTNASVGSKVGEVGEFTTKCGEDEGLRQTADRVLGVTKNTNVLLIPKRNKLWRSINAASLSVLESQRAWRAVASNEKHPTLSSESQKGVAIAEFLRVVGPAIKDCDEIIKLLNEVED